MKKDSILAIIVKLGKQHGLVMWYTSEDGDLQQYWQNQGVLAVVIAPPNM